MRWAAALTAGALFTIYLFLKLALPSEALKQDQPRASSADLKRPPTAFGSVVAAPENGKRPRSQSN